MYDYLDGVHVYLPLFQEVLVVSPVFFTFIFPPPTPQLDNVMSQVKALSSQISQPNNYSSSYAARCAYLAVHSNIVCVGVSLGVYRWSST